MKKILFCDVDGTIIDRDKALHPYNQEAIEKLRSLGYYMVLCTGRNEREMQLLFQKHQFSYDYLILNNGSRIIDKDGNDLYKKDISNEIGKSIIEYCMTYQDYSLFFYDGVRKLHLALIDGDTYVYGDNGAVLSKEFDFKEEYKKSPSFEIICFNQNNEKVDQTLKIKTYLDEKFSSQVSTHLNMYFLDIVPANCSKGSGIRTLLSLLDEDVESYAIGDSFNDIMMFEAVDHSYTFNRCDDTIKQHTKHQVDYVYEVINDMIGG